MREFADIRVVTELSGLRIAIVLKRVVDPEQLMAKLKKAGLVKSIRGAGGGYRLAKDAAEVSVGDVLRALEGDLEPATCAALHSEDSCEIQGSCITKYVWKKVNESMAQTVDSIMINTLVEMNKEVKKEGQKDE